MIATMHQHLVNFFLLPISKKMDFVPSTSKVSLRDNQVLPLCNEAGEGGNGNSGAVGGRRGDM